MPAEGAVVDGQKPADGQAPVVEQKPAGSAAAVAGAPNQDPKPGQKTGEPDAQRGLVADLQKERTARKKLEGQIADLTAKLEGSTKTVRALAGVETPNAEEAEAEAIRAELFKHLPQLGKLLDAKTFERLEKVLGMTDALERTTQHYWGRHGLNTLSAIEKKIGATFGELSDRQIKTIRSAYVTAAETDPAFAQRHEEDPEKLIEEFAQQWVEDWYEPSKRRITAEEIERQRRVPGARDRNLVTPGSDKPIDVTDDKAVGDLLVSGFRARGGEFGRRS